LVAWIVSSAALAADMSLEERFLKEAPEKWAEYRQIVARHVEGRSNSSGSISLGDRKVCEGTSLETFALNIDGKEARAKYVSFEKDRPQRVEAFNPDYHFEIVPGRGDRWTIERLRTGRTAIPEDLIGRHPLRPLVLGEETLLGRSMNLACVGQTLGRSWLPRMVASDDFRVTRATAAGGAGLVKVEFTFEPKEMTGGAYVRSGTVVLDSKRYWLVREANTETSHVFGSETEQLEGVRGRMTIKNEFHQGKMPVPYVSRRVYIAECDKALEGKPWKEVTELTIEMQDLPDIDQKQFTLSAYGLPEPAKK
jgi:hypothetical protein